MAVGKMPKKILFMGDSITDADRLNIEDKTGLGKGYVRIIADKLKALNYDAEVINKGFSGFKIHDLSKHWYEDCVRLEPDYVTILIGVNEVVAMMYGGDIPSSKDFNDNYEKLIGLIKDKTKAKIILMEPFIFNYPKEIVLFREYIDREIQIVRLLAEKHKTGFVNLDGIFSRFAIRFGRERFSTDGVHLTKQGHDIIAQEWLREFNCMQ